MRIAVVGAGSWGTALAVQLCRGGDDVWMWDHRADRAAEMDAARKDARGVAGLFGQLRRLEGKVRAAVFGASSAMLD